jgi:ABC-type branched-subunit amino acid transport system substrate-binding protein
MRTASSKVADDSPRPASRRAIPGSHCASAENAVDQDVGSDGSVLCGLGCQQANESIKIGYIDPLSGLFAYVGAQGLRELKLVIEQINERGGVP